MKRTFKKLINDGYVKTFAKSLKIRIVVFLKSVNTDNTAKKNREKYLPEENKFIKVRDLDCRSGKLRGAALVVYIMKVGSSYAHFLSKVLNKMSGNGSQFFTRE